AVAEAQDRFSAPVFLHEADRMLWDAVFPDEAPDDVIEDGDTFEIAGVTLEALHTPGHSPGSVCFLLEDEEGSAPVLFSGDTLFSGGPGATGRSYSDFGTIIESIRERLLTLPAGTTVNTGHGDSTTIGAEAPHLDEWIARGH
ncbi:MAG: MBL fold metallo-hydrolase, partial [Arthrobacter sp.]